MVTGIAIVAAGAAAVIAWFAENAAIHAMGYSGFAGAGWITAVIIPVGAAAWVWERVGRLAQRGRA
jgi:hypothetical protein